MYPPILHVEMLGLQRLLDIRFVEPVRKNKTISLLEMLGALCRMAICYQGNWGLLFWLLASLMKEFKKQLSGKHKNNFIQTLEKITGQCKSQQVLGGGIWRRGIEKAMAFE